MLKLYYVANARMPNEKAHGIQIAKMCEAFLAQGVDLTLVVPGRATHAETLKEFHHLTHEVPLRKIFVPDFYRTGRLGFFLSSLWFMVSVELFLWAKRVRGETFVVYTIDMDNFSYALLPLAGKTFTEMHTPKTPTWVERFFFKRVTGVIATNGLIRQRFVDDYRLPQSKVVSEPNGVDYDLFAQFVLRDDARTLLDLPTDKKIVLYVGRFYRWKGLDILAPACAKLSLDTVCYVVGGTKEEFVAVTGVTDVPENILFMGARPADEIPLWLQAADALLVLGTAKNEDSNRYTSPMKVFEYMASGKPIVASATPAIVDILSPEQAYLFEPDNADSLAHTIEESLTSADAGERAVYAQEKARDLTWTRRAERILAFIDRN